MLALDNYTAEVLLMSSMSPVARVAKQLKVLRDRRGFTQTELATRAGISRGYLSRLEIARQDPTLSVLEKLAKALGVNVARLLE